MFNFIFTADKASKKPLYEQLYSYVADEIKNKNIKENERMPSKKALAKYLGISVNTVETAYSILVQEGYLRAVARSGFYVCKVDIPVGDRNFEYEEEQDSVTAYKADFKTNKVDINSFPYSTWIKLSKEVMYSTPEYLNSGNVKGDYELRESIAKYLHEFRGVKCSPMQKNKLYRRRRKRTLYGLFKTNRFGYSVCHTVTPIPDRCGNACMA